MRKKTLLILGNGFDLDLGLRTSFNYYLETNTHLKHRFDTTTFAMIENKEKWGDIEGVLREAIMEAVKFKDEKFDKDVNYTWRVIREGWGMYLPKHIDDVQKILNHKHGSLVDDKSPIDKKSCAFSLASIIKDWNCVFSFNYTNPADLLFNIWPNNIHFIHGSFTPQIHSPYTMYQVANFIAIGVDYKRMNELIQDNELLYPIVKINFMGENLCKELFQAMTEADNVVIYGHSMSITDSDYFEDFFGGIIDGSIVNKSVYFVTLNKKSLSDIKKKMREWDLEYDNLMVSNNRILNIYTENGADNVNFKELLKLFL